LAEGASFDDRLRVIEDKLDALIDPLFDVPSTEDLQDGIKQLDSRVSDLLDRVGHVSPVHVNDVRSEQLQRVLSAFGVICRRQDAALDRFEQVLDRIDSALSTTRDAPENLVRTTQAFEKKVSEMLLHLNQMARPEPEGSETLERLEGLFERFDAALSASRQAPHGLMQVTQAFEKKVSEMLLHLNTVSLPRPIDLEAMERRLQHSLRGAVPPEAPSVAPDLVRHMQSALAELLADTARQVVTGADDHPS
jgi:hypothetical protein